MKFIAIAAGGSVGALLRYFVSTYPYKFIKPGFPLGTFLANIIGCFVIGFVFQLSLVKILSPNLRLFIMVGLLGSFTTFSTFSLETINLLKSGQLVLAVVNILTSVSVGLIAVFLGIKLSQMLFRL
jgi:CrcB protein